MTDPASLLKTGILVENVPLGPFTTYKSGGPARYLAEIARPDDLDTVLKSGIGGEYPVLVLGRGSNIVVSDSGFDGLVVRLGRGFAKVSFDGLRVTAGSALPLPRLARSSVDSGIAGLEFFVGIPGSVGGAVRQNAGCFGWETKDRLTSAVIVDLATGERRDAGPEDLDMTYRHSNVRTDELVIEAVFTGVSEDSGAGSELMRRITRWRKENQPGGTLNAGSVFKNPPGISAGELIDNLGLKGLRIGGVAVSEKHANFFVAGPDATSAEIHELFLVVKDRVRELSGTILEPEIQFVGFE